MTLISYYVDENGNGHEGFDKLKADRCQMRKLGIAIQNLIRFEYLLPRSFISQ